MYSISLCIKVVSNQGDGGRDERIDARQSPLYPGLPALALPSSFVSPNDPMASKTVRPPLTSWMALHQVLIRDWSSYIGSRGLYGPNMIFQRNMDLLVCPPHDMMMLMIAFKTRNFRVNTSDGESLGVWHILYVTRIIHRLMRLEWSWCIDRNRHIKPKNLSHRYRNWTMVYLRHHSETDLQYCISTVMSVLLCSRVRSQQRKLIDRQQTEQHPIESDHILHIPLWT